MRAMRPSEQIPQVGQQSSVLRVTNVGTSRIAFKVPLLEALLATVARNGEPRSKK